jgi:hypothetical protein
MSERFIRLADDPNYMIRPSIPLGSGVVDIGVSE